MTHTEKIWIIVGLGTFAGTIGLLVGLREIIYRVDSMPIHNRLRRNHGDIELNYIEPIQPDHAYHPLDAVNPNYMNYDTYNWPDRVSSYWSDRLPSYHTGQHAPSYYSGGNPPSFNTIDRGFINCSLEDNINLDYILWLILFCVFLLLIRKLIISNKINIEKIIILLLLSGLSIIYLQFGLLPLAQIIIWIIVFFLSNFLLGINPDNTQFKVIRAMAIIVIIFIINSLILNNSLYSISILIPFSTFEIDFRDSFEWKFNSYKVKPMISYLKLQTLTKDINLLLLSLLDDSNYSMGLSFISSYKEWEKDKGKNYPLFIDDAIIINKESDSLLITQFIMENLDKKGLFISEWFFKDYSTKSAKIFKIQTSKFPQFFFGV
jgi:hypothetical protein